MIANREGARSCFAPMLHQQHASDWIVTCFFKKIIYMYLYKYVGGPF